jgi:hypothetical protein
MERSLVGQDLALETGEVRLELVDQTSDRAGLELGGRLPTRELAENRRDPHFDAHISSLDSFTWSS